MPKLRDSIRLLERLSLVSCPPDVYQLLERALMNVQPITTINTEGWDRLLWQNGIDFSRLHGDQVSINLGTKGLKESAPGFFEDYVSVGLAPGTSKRR